MKKIILPYSKELSEYAEDTTNFEVIGDTIEITFHSEQDLFSIGEQFGKWQSSTVRLQNYIP